jgi:hypothetical protein
MTIGADGNECDDVIIGADGFEYDDVDELTFVNHYVEPGEESSGAYLQEYDANLEEYDFVADEEYIFHQAAKHVSPTWILLDSQSTTGILAMHPCSLTSMNQARSSTSTVTREPSALPRWEHSGTTEKFGTMRMQSLACCLSSE